MTAYLRDYIAKSTHSEIGKSLALNGLHCEARNNYLTSDDLAPEILACAISESMVLAATKAPDDSTMLRLMKATGFTSDKLRKSCRELNALIPGIAIDSALLPIFVLARACLRTSFKSNDPSRIATLVTAMLGEGLFSDEWSEKAERSLKTTTEDAINNIMASQNGKSDTIQGFAAGQLAAQGGFEKYFVAKIAGSKETHDEAMLIAADKTCKNMFHDDFYNVFTSILYCFIHHSDLFRTPFFGNLIYLACHSAPISSIYELTLKAYPQAFKKHISEETPHDTLEPRAMRINEECDSLNYRLINILAGQPVYHKIQIHDWAIDLFKHLGYDEREARDHAVTIGTLIASKSPCCVKYGIDTIIPDDAPKAESVSKPAACEDTVPREQYDALLRRVKELEAANKEERHNVQTARKEADEAREKLRDNLELIDLYEQILNEKENPAEAPTEGDDEPPAADAFPYKSSLNVILYGGFDNFQTRIKELFPNMRVISPYSRNNLDPTPFRNADIIFFQQNCCGHGAYYSIRDIASTYDIPFYHLDKSGHTSCADYMLDIIQQTEAKCCSGR